MATDGIFLLNILRYLSASPFGSADNISHELRETLQHVKEYTALMPWHPLRCRGHDHGGQAQGIDIWRTPLGFLGSRSLSSRVS